MTTANQNSVLKAVSANYKCVLIYDSTSGSTSLKAYNFDLTTTAAILTTSGDTVTANSYTGNDPATLDRTNFAIADNCKALRVSNVIINKHTDNIFYANTLPTGVTLANSAFSPDMEILVTNAGIYYYTARSGTTAGSYTQFSGSTTETCLDSKRI